MSRENKAIVKRSFDVPNTGNLDALHRVCSRWYVIPGLLALLATIAVACGELEPTAAPTPTPEPALSTYEELLELIPNRSGTRSYVLMNDHSLIRELFDIPLPGPSADEDTLGEYIIAMSGSSVTFEQRFPRPGLGTFIGGFVESALRLLGRHQYLAFDVRNIDQSITAGVPPGQLEVVGGRFDPEATDKALKACSECEAPLHEEHRGVPFYSWGEDFVVDVKRRFAPPAFDQLGRGGRIAVQDRYVFYTVETPGMKDLIEASVGRRRSLADVEEFAILAKEMSDLGA